MNYEAWTVNLKTNTATHESGFLIRIEGNPLRPSGVSPFYFPENLNAADQAKLLRVGMRAFLKAAKNKEVSSAAVEG